MLIESFFQDVRFGFRGIRRSPLFAASVASTIGLGLGVLCSAFTIVNVYILRPIDFPEPHALYALNWDTASTRRHGFTQDDYDALQTDTSQFSGVVAERHVVVMQDGVAMQGLLVSPNYFDVLGAKAARGRTLTPADGTATSASQVVVLSDDAWRTRYGADPDIIGKRIDLGRQRFDVVGLMPPNVSLPGNEPVGFMTSLAMASAFDVSDPLSDQSDRRLTVVGRLRNTTTEPQARAWFDVWLHQRFGSNSEATPRAVHLESRATRIPLTGPGLTMFVLIVSAFGLVLLVACANVTNLMLARGFSRQREIAVRLSLGANRGRVIRQLVIESLVLAVPAAAIGFALTLVTARAFPALIVSTFPANISVQSVPMPLDPDLRVIGLLCIAAALSAVLVSLAPAVRVTRANLVRASKGEAALDTQRSRLRTGLVAMQIGACVIFLVGATGLIDESMRLSSPTTGLAYERVAYVRLAPGLRADLATRLASDPAVDAVAAAWRPPLNGPLRTVNVVASQTRLEQRAGFMVVSPEYFPLFDIRVTRGRVFTAQEANDSAPLVLVSEQTARTLWPGLDPIGQTLDLIPSADQIDRRPAQTSVRVIGVTEDVLNGLLIDDRPTDATCIYFATGFRASGDVALLVRSRTDVGPLRPSVTAAMRALDPNAPFQFFSMTEMIGVQAWVFQSFSAAASILGSVGLLLAFSGTYAVVAFLVAQRTREFGIRMALGATVSRIVSGMMNETMRIAFAGLAAGLAVSMGLVQLLRGTASIVPNFGPGTYLLATAVVLMATVVAALLPTLRTTRINPSTALRVE